MIKRQTKKPSQTIISLNKRALYEYHIEDECEAGLVLKGWEVKSLRTCHVNISNSYVILKNGEAFLFGANFTPSAKLSSYDTENDPMRTRKLLLNQYELDSLYGHINRHRYTVVTLSLYWKYAWCKVKIGVVRGKKQHDKRNQLKIREWQRNKARIMKT